MGNVIQAGNKMNPARQAAIDGGVPVEVPAMTVNRVCGSGAQAIASAAQEIMLGLIDSAVAGGMENMDRAPVSMTAGAGATAWATRRSSTRCSMDGLNDAFSGEHSGWHTEDLVDQHQITRDEQDRWALRSQQRFAAAQAAGQFAAEIVAGRDPGAQGPGSVRQGRAQSARHHAREPLQAEARLPQGRHHHGRQRAGPQQRAPRR